MRTYSRKKVKYELLEDVHTLCRLCLGSSTEVVPIFDEVSKSESGDLFAPLPLRIMICVGLEVTREESLPNSVCQACYDELNRCYIFRKKCEFAYQRLKSHLLAVKDIGVTKLQEVTDDTLKTKTYSKLQDATDDALKTKTNENETKEINIIEVCEDNGNDNNKEVDILSNISCEAQTNVEHHNKEAVTDSVDPDLAMFLRMSLIEQGILKEQGTDLSFNMDVSTADLEMGDGTRIIFNLVEESEEEERMVLYEENVSNGVSDNAMENKDIVIQYITSNTSDEIQVEQTVKGKRSSWCGVCGKRFASSSVAARHARVHSGERPFACRVCARRFTQREVCVRHELVHSERRPFACARCDKSFTQRGALAAHERAHAPPHARALALHQCPRCPKVFLYRSGLSRHMREHSGKVYKCGTCDRLFNDKTSMGRHWKNAHGRTGNKKKETANS